MTDATQILEHRDDACHLQNSCGMNLPESVPFSATAIVVFAFDCKRRILCRSNVSESQQPSLYCLNQGHPGLPARSPAQRISARFSAILAFSPPSMEFWNY